MVIVGIVAAVGNTDVTSVLTIGGTIQFLSLQTWNTGLPLARSVTKPAVPSIVSVAKSNQPSVPSAPVSTPALEQPADPLYVSIEKEQSTH